MPYAFVQDIAASGHDYESASVPALERIPPGLILQGAGPTDKGFRIIAVWESEPLWQRFRAERLGPAIAALGGPARPEPTFRDLYPVHLVVGARGNAESLESQTREDEK